VALSGKGNSAAIDPCKALSLNAWLNAGARLRSAPAKSKRGVELISDVLPFGQLWYVEPDAVSNAIGYAKFYSRSHQAVIRVYDEAGNAIGYAPRSMIYLWQLKRLATH
jgi:hypothetical protein